MPICRSAAPTTIKILAKSSSFSVFINKKNPFHSTANIEALSRARYHHVSSEDVANVKAACQRRINGECAEARAGKNETAGNNETRCHGNVPRRRNLKQTRVAEARRLFCV